MWTKGPQPPPDYDPNSWDPPTPPHSSNDEWTLTQAEWQASWRVEASLPNEPPCGCVDLAIGPFYRVPLLACAPPTPDGPQNWMCAARRQILKYMPRERRIKRKGPKGR